MDVILVQSSYDGLKTAGRLAFILPLVLDNVNPGNAGIGSERPDKRACLLILAWLMRDSSGSRQGTGLRPGSLAMQGSITRFVSVQPNEANHGFHG